MEIIIMVIVLAVWGGGIWELFFSKRKGGK